MCSLEWAGDHFYTACLCPKPSHRGDRRDCWGVAVLT